MRKEDIVSSARAAVESKILKAVLAEEGHSTCCAVCGGGECVFVREGRDCMHLDSSRIFALTRCLSCGLISQTPVPSEDELRKAYSGTYGPYRPAWKEAGWPLWKILRVVTTWRRMQRLRKYGKGNRLLEVGTGAGDFLQAARKAAWSVCGVEYSNHVAESLRTELDMEVLTGELQPGLWESATFDVVVLWSVIEHVVNPIETLTTACSYLKTGGVVLIQMPTAPGAQFGKAFGEYWAVLDFPRHLNFFWKRIILGSLFEIWYGVNCIQDSVLRQRVVLPGE